MATKHARRTPTARTARSKTAPPRAAESKTSSGKRAVGKTRAVPPKRAAEQKRAATGKRTAKRKRPTARVLSAAQVSKAVTEMSAASGTGRFAAGKALCVTAEKDPARVYPFWDDVAGLIHSESKVVRWNAIRILSLLTAVDEDHKIDGMLDPYLAPILGDNLITACNVIQGAGRIATSRSDLLDRVIPALLAVEGATYATPECRNVAIGHVLDVLVGLPRDVTRRPDCAEFIRRQRTNPRAAVAKKALQMFAEHGLQG